MEMSRLTRDGTAEPVSRDQILRHARGPGNINFPCSADHEQDWQPDPVDQYSAILNFPAKTAKTIDCKKWFDLSDRCLSYDESKDWQVAVNPRTALGPRLSAWVWGLGQDYSVRFMSCPAVEGILLPQNKAFTMFRTTSKNHTFTLVKNVYYCRKRKIRTF